MLSELLSLPKNKLTTGKMIDDNFRKIAVENHLEGVTKLVEGADWETPTNRVIADNLLDKVSSLLNAKIIRSTVVNHKGQVKKRIIIEYDEPS